MQIENSKPVDQLFDVAVVIPTIIRPSLIHTVRSVFQQSFKGPIQILIGIDKRQGDQKILDFLHEHAPENVTITVVDPGYSTSVRHGGIHTARDGGSLRTVLTFLANCRYVAYLDDDNWWHKHHLSSLLEAIEGVEWAFSHRWLVDEDNDEKLTVDKWHSVGPGKGYMNATIGGFVDPNTLMIDKIACADQLHLWSVAYKENADFSGADRKIFEGLSQNKTYRGTNQATVYYKIRKNNILWSKVSEEFEEKAKNSADTAPAGD